MGTVSLQLPENDLYKHTQILEFDKIATFIGGNGSGKSSILKSIFDEKLKPGSTIYQDYKVVCFSSGQNESYSEPFGRHLNKERLSKKALSLDCFYYDKSWSKLLIFLATTGISDGLVRAFLRQNNYVIESELEEDESTKLSLDVRVGQGYIKVVKDALQDAAEDENVRTNKAYHRTLHNFISSQVNESYDFQKPLEQVNIKLNQDLLSRVSFEADDRAPFDSKVMFFTQAADNDYFIVKESLDLIFEKVVDGQDNIILRLEELSDGEYQLLFLYALIDLFDNQKTLFLFDEADSHLHYKNIDKLWKVYNEIQGSIITTTHLLDSIAKSGIKRLQVIKNGEIKAFDKIKQVAERLRDLSEINDVNSQALSLCENIVLIDDKNDWEQFKLLLKQKLVADDFTELDIDKTLNSFIAIKCNSGYEGGDNEVFADKKLSWLERFVEYLSGQAYNTKNIFLICDRDEFPLTNIGTGECSLLVKGKKVNKFNNNQLACHLLSWKRREIKHYLLSPTALSQDIETLNEMFDLGPKTKLVAGKSGDYDIEGKYNKNLAALSSEPIKELMHPYINIDGQGFCIEKTREFVSRIPEDEISEDIVNMYYYLVGENE
jgi:ABC-type cobalamin/Fe3+-siderophores transport system ATPase subunit